MSRLYFISLAVSVWVTAVLAPALVPAAAAEAASALACAKADLALMHKLADEPEPTAVTSIRLAQASMHVLEARAACRSGNYANGLALYWDADVLAGREPSPALTERR